MLSLLEESWKRVQPLLRERIGASTYEAWMPGLRPVMLERGTVYLEAESRLAADRVRALFRNALSELLSADFGTELAVEIQAREHDRMELLEVSPQRPIVDDGNRTAHLVLESLIGSGGDLPARRELPANQVLFHGPAGVGKSFLLRWWREQVSSRPMWFDLPSLLKAFQAAHQESRVEGLLEELVAPRPLVLDEVHRVAHKRALQQFLLRVLRRREGDGSLTLLASRWHPTDIHDLDPSLASTLLAGFVAAVDRPGPLGRLRYLRALEGAPSRNGRASHIESLAQHTVGSFPELRAAWAAARGRPLPPKYLELIDPGRIFQQVRDRVAQQFGVRKEDLLGKGQGRGLSRARKVLALLCQQRGLTGGEIGRFLGRTRAAVSYMLLTLQEDLAKSAELRQQVEALQ